MKDSTSSQSWKSEHIAHSLIPPLSLKQLVHKNGYSFYFISLRQRADPGNSEMTSAPMISYYPPLPTHWFSYCSPIIWSVIKLETDNFKAKKKKSKNPKITFTKFLLYHIPGTDGEARKTQIKIKISISCL